VRLIEDEHDVVTLQILGFQHAANRFTGGGQHVRDLMPALWEWYDDPTAHNPFSDSVDPRHLHFALGEAMNYFASADWALGGASGLAECWPGSIDDGGIIGGFRFVRNAIHHDHAEAIDFGDHTFDGLTRGDVSRLTWAEPHSSQRRGREDFRQHLLGESIVVSLARLGAALWAGAAEYL
jgi:hypothetical protein